MPLLHCRRHLGWAGGNGSSSKTGPGQAHTFLLADVCVCLSDGRRASNDSVGVGNTASSLGQETAAVKITKALSYSKANDLLQDTTHGIVSGLDAVPVVSAPKSATAELLATNKIGNIPSRLNVLIAHSRAFIKCSDQK